jgi:hypothetical protein
MFMTITDLINYYLSVPRSTALVSGTCINTHGGYALLIASCLLVACSLARGFWLPGWLRGRVRPASCRI